MDSVITTTVKDALWSMSMSFIAGFSIGAGGTFLLTRHYLRKYFC